MWELLCQNGHLARELFFRRVVAFEKLLFDFRHTTWRNFQPYLLSYIQQFDCFTWCGNWWYYTSGGKFCTFLYLWWFTMRGVFWICTTAIRDNILGQGESWEGRLETNFQNGMKTHFFYYLSFLGSEPFHKMKMNLFYFLFLLPKMKMSSICCWPSYHWNWIKMKAFDWQRQIYLYSFSCYKMWLGCFEGQERCVVLCIKEGWGGCFYFTTLLLSHTQ